MDGSEASHASPQQRMPEAAGVAAADGGHGSVAGKTSSGSAGAPAADGGGGARAELGTSEKPEQPAMPSDAGADATLAPASEPPVRPTHVGEPTEVIVPAETADDVALRRLTALQQLPVFGTGRYLQRSSSDRKQPNEAEEMLLPILAHDNRDMNNFVCKSADAQVSTALIAYHYDFETCPEAYVRGVVLGRYEGSGELVRLWMTIASISLAGGMLADEMMRVYVDDNPRPLVQVPLKDVLSGAAGEVFAPPFGAAAQGSIAWYYPVVFSTKLVVAIDRLSSDYYFQTDAVLDPEPKPRFAPLMRSSQRDVAAAQLKAASPAPEAGMLAAESIELTRDQPRVVKLEGPATIRDLRLRVASDKLASLASVHVAVRWDSAEKDAIDLPLLDLFAARRAVVERSNLVLAATKEGGDQLLSLRLPMPFATGAEWTLSQTGDVSVGFELEWFGTAEVPEATYGRLNVQLAETPIPATQLEVVVARASGRGRYVGMCADLEGRADNSLGVFGTSPLNFLEGDIRVMVDGQLALDGTGTEDYPDNAFYFRDSPQATPFAQNWGLVDSASSTPPGQVSFCRWQVLGGEVDFQSDLSATHEIAVGDPSIVDLHRTIAFLYLP